MEETIHYHPKTIEINSKLFRRCKLCREVKELNEENFIKRNEGHSIKVGNWRGKCRICFNKNLRIKEEKSKSEIERSKRYLEKLRINRPFARMLSAAKGRAKKANLQFDITEEFLSELYKQQEGLCYYTKVPMNFDSKNDNKISLDKIDPKKGYIRENVALTCFKVNVIKNSLNKEELLEFCRTVLKNHG